MKKYIKPDFYIQYLPVNSDCKVSIFELSKVINDGTGIVSVMYANNETGAINPIKSIGEICKNKNLYFHTDCVQAAGIHPIDVNRIGCDFLSISSHKIHAPKGIGALYVRDTQSIVPLIIGGKEQEYGLRGGTENVANIVGFGKACEITYKNIDGNRNRIMHLRDLFASTLIKVLDGNGYKDTDSIISFNAKSPSSKILNIRVKGVDAQTLTLIMSSDGVCISAGSACRSQESVPSRVLTAIGMSEDEARESIRISFSNIMSDDECIEAAHKLAKCILLLKNMTFTA